MNVCWSPKDGGSGHDRWVSDNGADKWVMMGYANKCGGMQELGWWLFTSMGHQQATGLLLCSHGCHCSGCEKQQQWRQVWWEIVVQKQ